jgi:predicted dehydrogenase
MTTQRKLRMGLIGPGWVASHHVDAVRRLGDVDVVAVAGTKESTARTRADQMHIEQAYGDYREMLRDADVDVVHNTTASHVHYETSMAVIEAGKHIVSDKPLALTPAECAKLRDAAKAAGVANAVTFNYRGNSMVQQARQMLAENQLGALTYIHGHYLQDWMTDPNVYSWRMDPEKGGVSSALADIGSHWCDLAEHISGAKIASVMADLATAIPTRYKPEGGSMGSFTKGESVADTKKVPVQMFSEDIASILLRFDNGARGCVRVGQVLPGHKNDVEIEINGLERSIRWQQEEANDLWVGSHKQPNAIITKDAGLLLPEAAQYAILPAGHQEGWADAFAAIVRGIYAWIRAGAAPEAKPVVVCDFTQATRTCSIIDAMLKSNAGGGVWQSVDTAV